ncbi:MAG: hypothetical protein M1837_005306 [Sclerophora amabilis]|nr:MAG: hypothetical protein M1837_005306 [Sclerophora amabilis]
MHILLVNDDGPPSNQSSPYVHSLVSSLQAAGHVVSVVLPHTQRSWIGKAHIVGATIQPTYFRPGTLHEDDGAACSRPLPADSKAEEWVLIDGTPASCVQVGLYHFFQDRGPVDLVLSGPNYGRNTTAVFGLSSGTLGGALEGAMCQQKSIALSYAFFSRDHDPKIIASASRLAVRLVEHLHTDWNSNVDVYSINIPLVSDVESHKILYTHMLQNTWTSGSAFKEIEVEDEGLSPEEHERSIRQDQSKRPEDDFGARHSSRHEHKHLKWAPKFADVHQSVERNSPGNDGWAVKEGYTSVTPLKANFMHASGLDGELKLPIRTHATPADNNKVTCPHFFAIVNYDDHYVQPLIVSALHKIFPPSICRIISSLDELDPLTAPIVQISSYESLPFDHIINHPATSLANAYIFRKALIRKHYLASTIASWITKSPKSLLTVHFKAALDFELDYAEFLDEALVEAYELHDSFARNEHKESQDREWWILKPGMSDRGQGIRLFSTQEELLQIFEKWELEQPDEEEEDFSEGGHDENTNNNNLNSIPSSESVQSDEKDGSQIITSQLRHFIAQPYIHSPFLFPFSPRKFHIRTYVLAVGSLRVYVYGEMLALFAATPYVPPWHPSSACNEDLSAHLTNTCLQTNNITSSTTFPSPPPPATNLNDSHVHRFWDLPPHPSSSSTVDWKPAVFDQILAITSETFLAAARTTAIHFQPLPNAFEVFGLDFLVDEQRTAWLLEVNAFPDFAQTGEVLRDQVVGGLWDGVIKTAVLDWWTGLDRSSSDEVPVRGWEGHEAGKSKLDEGEENGGMSKVLDIDLGRRT